MSVRYEIETDVSNGEVMLDDIMSPDWSALQSHVVPINASGNYTPLKTGTVSIKVSPFESGDYWVDVNDNNYYGIAVRLKIIKNQISPSIDKLIVSIWRSNISPQSVVDVSPDISVGNVTTQSYKERANKAGKLFTASRRITDVVGLSNIDSIFITGATQVIFNQRIIGYTGKGVIASIYRGATYTGGVAGEITNPNDVNPQTPTAQLFSGATIILAGQLTVAPTYSEGNASNQGQGNSQANLGEQVIMQPNTVYLLRITSLDTASQNVNSYISWFEDSTYLP